MLEVELLNGQTAEAIDEEIVDPVEEVVEQSVVETVDGLIAGEEIILQQQEVILCFHGCVVIGYNQSGVIYIAQVTRFLLLFWHNL